MDARNAAYMNVLIDDLVPVGLDLVGFDIVKFFTAMPLPINARLTRTRKSITYVDIYLQI